MGFKLEPYCAQVRAKCDLAREHFRKIISYPAYAKCEGYFNSFSSSAATPFRCLKNAREYTANIVYIVATSVEGSVPRGEKSSGGAPSFYTTPPSNRRYYSDATIYNFSACTLLRGYLTPMTLEEYCTKHNITHNAARVYQVVPNGSTDYAELNAPIIDKSTLMPFDEYETLKNKIVPVIKWYYTNGKGERVDTRQNLSILYYFTANSAQITTYKSVVNTRLFAPKTVTFDTQYYSVSPPYVSPISSVHSNTRYGANLNGAIYCTWGSDTSIKTPNGYVDREENPYYTMIIAGWTKTVGSSGLYNIDDDLYTNAAYKNAYNITNTGATIMPVFNSTDDIISLFADYGVTVTTDFNEVISPTPTPEESAKPNPDPTDREIPNFPDNTTDYTPVEPAYITPSTFGQSCVYTPTTTRDFLAWICDSTVDVGNWARLFANPADVITGINLYNLDIVAHDSGRVQYNKNTNILGVQTAIPNYSIIDGYNNIVDGGTLHLQAYYGNYADFTSMTYQMYVPFVGFTTLRACDVVNKTLHLYYAVDFATGSAVAFVNSDDKLIYTSPCTVAGRIPLSTSDRNSQMINNTLSVLGGLSGLLGGVASGNVGGGVGALMGGLGGLQMQTNYSNKGSLSSVNIYKLIPAFVERTRYDLFMPSNDSAYINAKYQSAAGAPSTQFDTLLNCVDAGGFVQSDVVYLTSQTATEAEKQQIIDLIKSGIYL